MDHVEVDVNMGKGECDTRLLFSLAASVYIGMCNSIFNYPVLRNPVIFLLPAMKIREVGGERTICMNFEGPSGHVKPAIFLRNH